MISSRLSRRLVRHHLPIALLCLISGYFLYVTRPYTQIIPRLSFASAYPALFLLCLTLLLGPWKLFMGERLAASFDLRRDIGIWAGVTGLFHTLTGQFVHMAGRFWLYYVYDKWRDAHVQPFRHDLFGFSNDTGLLASLILLALLATSNDASLRWLGTPGWKSLQRWNYGCFVLAAAHTFGYQAGGGRGLFLYATIAAVAITAVLQFFGWRFRRLAT